jgi:hypothetical protein
MAIQDGDKTYLGSIAVKVTTPEFAIEGKKALAEFRRQMNVAHRKGIEEGKAILEKVVRDERIFDTGKLLRSVSSMWFVKSTDIFSGTVHFANPGKEYAYFVEHGRGPGKPPPFSKMKAWGERKGIPYDKVMAIRSKIARVGTKPHPFFEKATEQVVNNYNKIVDRAVDKYRSRN